MKTSEKTLCDVVGEEETQSCKLSLLFYLLCFVVVPSAALQVSKFLPVAVAERVANEEGLQRSARRCDVTLNGREKNP